MARVSEKATSEWILANEFAQVRLEIDYKGNSARVRIEDLHSGHSICLDAMTLASLVWASDEMLAAHSDPDLTYKALRREAPGVPDLD
jgi:hypothetical protein